MPPPRKMIAKSKDNDSTRSGGKNINNRFNKKGNAHDMKDVNEPAEPEIDVQAKIEEMLRESNEKIMAVLQQRQENLCQTISQVDGMVFQATKTMKK